MDTESVSKVRYQVSVRIEESAVEVNLSGIISARALDVVLTEMVRTKGRSNFVDNDCRLVVDLSQVKAVMPSGATSLVSLCSALMEHKIGDLARPSIIELRRPPSHVLTYLTRIGFFTAMASKADLVGCTDLVRTEEEKASRSTAKDPKDIWDRQERDNKPVVWPISLIGHKESHRTRLDFDCFCQRLVNNAAQHFEGLFASPHFNFDGRDMHDFLLSNYELYMNVFDHSKSWGLTMIHARPKYGTFVCCHDIGIGVRENVKSSPKVKSSFSKDSDAIRWALTEGNSSRIDGNGLGLNIVEDFVCSRKGMLEIRSGECLMQRSPRNVNWRSHHVPWFPGTQINLFVPVRSG